MCVCVINFVGLTLVQFETFVYLAVNVGGMELHICACVHTYVYMVDMHCEIANVHFGIP